MQHAEEVDATNAIIREILDREDEDERWDAQLIREGRTESEYRAVLARYRGERPSAQALLRQLEEERNARAQLIAEISAQKVGQRDSLAVALHHVARKMGLTVTTLAPLRNYYERGEGLLEGDRETGALTFSKPVVLKAVVPKTARKGPVKRKRAASSKRHRSRST